MAFKRTKSKTFTANVTVNVANDKGGYDVNTFVAIFEHADTEEVKELRQLEFSDLVRRKLKGWELVDDETKQPVPFSAAELDAILLIPPSPLSICTAFWETLNGARAKNS